MAEIAPRPQPATSGPASGPSLLRVSLRHLAASYAGMLLVEVAAMRWVAPSWAPTAEAAEGAVGRQLATCLLMMLVCSAAFWGFGLLFALPALLEVRWWKIQVARTLDSGALLRALPLIAFNHFSGLVLVPLALVAFLPEGSFDWRQLPGGWTLARDVAVWILTHEVLFFHAHKWLHENKAMYAAIHKVHHAWTSPVSFAAIYCHPVEHVFSNIVPLLAGPVLCGSHIAAVTVSLFVGLIHTTGVHSGYWICDDDGMHDEHHAKFSCNYGVSGIMDVWYGTCRLPPGAAGAPARPEAARKAE